MEIATTPSTLSSIFHQRCPRCRLGGIFRGSIFRGFPKMQERCPVCDLKFAREAGYFIGAMYISYGIALLTITLIAALLWAVTGWWITKDVIWAVILFLPFPLSHFLPVFCGSIWIRRLIRRHADLNLARRITDLLRFPPPAIQLLMCKSTVTLSLHSLPQGRYHHVVPTAMLPGWPSAPTKLQAPKTDKRSFRE